MKINILGNDYHVVDTKEKITVADSFVVPNNKIGTGNGEAKLYIGHNNPETRNLFGNKGFKLKCFLLKKDLIKYLNETRDEYLKPQQPYLKSNKLPNLWNKRMDSVLKLPNLIPFEVEEQTQILGPRIYIKSSDNAYIKIRELSLPNITYISVVKLFRGSEFFYYFRLFADYFGEVVHPFALQKEFKQIEEIDNQTDKNNISNARSGQGKYREELLKQCPVCPITLITDDRLLIASHIKPWVDSNKFEKTDPKNGFMFTPTFDYLFDRGFLSFTDDKKSILSPFLSKMTYSKLGISDGKTFSHLQTSGRKSYLDFHRNNILKI